MLRKIFVTIVVGCAMMACNGSDSDKGTGLDTTNNTPVSSEAQKIMEVDADSSSTDVLKDSISNKMK